MEDANKLRDVAHRNNQIQNSSHHERTLTSETGSSEVNSIRSETDYYTFPIHRTARQTVNQTQPMIFQSPIYAYQDQTPWISSIVPYMPSPTATIYYPILPTVQPKPQRFVSDPISVPNHNHNYSEQDCQSTPNENSSKRDQMNKKAATWIGDSEVESEFEAIEHEDEDNVNLDSEESEYCKYPGSSFIGSDEDEKGEQTELSYIDLASEEYEKGEHPGSSYIDSDSESSGQDDENDEQATRSVDSVELPHYQSFRSNMKLRRTSSFAYQESDEVGTEDEPDGEIAYIIEFKTE